MIAALSNASLWESCTHHVAVWYYDDNHGETFRALWPFESTASALASASGSVLSSEVLTKHVHKARANEVSKQPRGQASLSRIGSRSRGSKKAFDICHRLYS